jgi:cytochrome c oxidase subunit 3
MSTDKSAVAGHHHHGHHYDSNEHEYRTAKEGIWLFLTSEILMFGGLFVAYLIFHQLFPAVFHEGSQHLDWKMGALNTIVLLTSSLTMVLGVHYVQTNQKNKALFNLAVTVACGAIFMIVKYFEYSHKIHDGLLPGTWFKGDTHGLANMGLYYSFYFMMTGLHGSHVLIGMGLIIWVMLRIKKGDFSPEYFTAVEGVGLFWHLVDLIWIFLFPLLYLVGG